MLAARQSVHSGSIKEFFAPFHVEIKASAKNEVSAAIVNETVGTTSGQKTRVLDKTTPVIISIYLSFYQITNNEFLSLYNSRLVERTCCETNVASKGTGSSGESSRTESRSA